MLPAMTYVGDPRFREPAIGDGIFLHAWGAQLLYIGPALGLTPHRNAVAVLAVALDAPFGVAADPADASAGYRRCRSVLIPPNILHHLAGMTGRMAFLYLDARSRDLASLRDLATVQTARAAFDLGIETELINCLGRLADGDMDWDESRRQLDTLISRPRSAAVDPRVAQALERLHANPGSRLALSDLARDVRLSESRLLHLFKEALGLPFRRYKIWIAMGAAMRSITRGETLTTAALDAGFASSAHFSATFRTMFGVEPSRLYRGRLTGIREPRSRTDRGHSASGQASIPCKSGILIHKCKDD